MLAVSVLASASIALLNDRLELVPYLIRLGRRTISTIKINTTVALGTKLIFIGLAIAGLSSLALAIFCRCGRHGHCHSKQLAIATIRILIVEIAMTPQLG
jgi:hypothetical protein